MKSLKIKKFNIEMQITDKDFNELQSINVDTLEGKFKAKIVILQDGADIVLVVNENLFEDIKDDDKE